MKTESELTSQLCKVLVSDIEKIFWPARGEGILVVGRETGQ